MFDTHIHLNDEAFKDNLEHFIKEGIEAGVYNFLIIGFDLESSKKAIELSHKYENCFAAIGFHPCDVDKIENNKVLQDFLMLCNDEKVVAIGEIGLDYYWVKDEESRKKQKERFIYQLELARKLKLPVSIHTREATQDTYDILKNYNDLTIVLHCFNASKEMLNNYLKLNTYFAIGGVVTFKNATNLQDVVKLIPNNRLLIETDAPYLSPVPYRGKLNEPKYIKETLKFIAKLKDFSFDELDEITTLNAKRVFLNER